MPGPHKCPMPGCNVQVAYTQLACKPHWYWLPLPLRRAITETYRGRKVEAHRANINAALKLYAAAGT